LGRKILLFSKVLGIVVLAIGVLTVRFVFAVAAKVPEVKDPVKQVIAVPKAETPCLNMKSRFKLEDSLKL
jgi:hypothetical protein